MHITTTNTAAREVITRARAFRGRLETVRCLVEQDGSVLVWDDVAGHYTRLHSLSASAVRRISKLASE